MPETKPVNLPFFKFTANSSTSEFTIAPQTYLSKHADSDFTHLSVGAVVFDNIKSKDRRMLLVQRSAHDSWPNRWEIPGGSCDDDDPSILHSVARELWEESGLVALKVGPVSGDVFIFISPTNNRIGYFVFFVEVEEGADGRFTVKLDPEEHQSHVWASEAEVQKKKVGDIELKFSTADMEAVVLRAFTLSHSEEERL